MTPEEHAAEAALIASSMIPAPLGTHGVVIALQGLTHAVLSLRPAPATAPVARIDDDDDLDPDTLPWGTCVAATLGGRTGVRLLLATRSSQEWSIHDADVRDGIRWAYGHDLSDITVTQLGPAS